MDLGRLGGHRGEEGVALSFYQLMDSGPLEARLKVFRVGPPLSLSEVLPVLSSMGVEVVDERPYELAGLPQRESRIYDFGLRYHRALPASGRELFQDAVTAVWDDHNEIDGFNALVLAAGLTWRQATLLRAYAKYMRQGGTPSRRTTSRTRSSRTSTSPATSSSCSRSTPAATATWPPTPRLGWRAPRSCTRASAGRSTTW